MRVLLFTGKGGVGKTTAAAATAVRAASRGMKTLVISTDPAHSLADAFDRALGGEPTELDTGLAGMQIDAQSSFERSWRQVQGYLLSVLSKAGIDPIEAEELTVLPGADEVLALLAVRAQVDSGRWDLVVVDCAPTAETLRLLALPDALDWYMRRLWPIERRVVRSLRPMLTRVAGVPMPSDAVFDAVERLHAELASVKAMLSDPQRTAVRLVLTPEAVVVAEARRTLTTLSLYGYRVDAVIANRIFPSGDDPWRDTWARAQQAQLTAVKESFAPMPLLRLGYQQAEPVGLAALTEVGEQLYGDQDPLAMPDGPEPISVRRSADGFVLALALPFVTREEVGLTRRGDELSVTVGSWRRLLSLPSVLRRCVVAGARLSEGGAARELRARPGAMDAAMTAPGFDHRTHGPLAEEAAKLAEALSSWASGGFVHSLLSGVGESAECNVCPVCQLLRVAKGSRPEVFEHLADASASLLAALRAALESSQAAWTAGSRPTSERIDIS